MKGNQGGVGRGQRRGMGIVLGYPSQLIASECRFAGMHYRAQANIARLGQDVHRWISLARWALAINR